MNAHPRPREFIIITPPMHGLIDPRADRLQFAGTRGVQHWLSDHRVISPGLMYIVIPMAT